MMAMRLQRIWRAVAGQTLRIHRRPEDMWDSFVRPRAQQVQICADAQHHHGFGEQAVLNFATYVGHVLRHDITWTDRMAHYWLPGQDDTTWMLRARTMMKKTHSVVTADEKLYDFSLACAASEYSD